MSGVAVTKMHGTYNDFAVVDTRKDPLPGDPGIFARSVCDRRGGVGCDGLILIETSDRADARMRIFNADGSEAEMCGNGLRCVTRFLSEAGEGDRYRIDTASGIVDAEVLAPGETYTVRVAIGKPEFEQRSLPFADADFVRIGNPHVVLFERSLDARDLIATAEQLQRSFPDGVNVHTTVPVSAHRLDVRHWERGVGPTFACGSGAAACAAAAIRRGLAQSPVEVHVPGGVLTIEWDGKGVALLSGPAARVFDTRLESGHEAAV